MNTCQMIKTILQDEKDAPSMYEKLKVALDKRDKATINKIIADEKRHYEEVSEIMMHSRCK